MATITTASVDVVKENVSQAIQNGTSSQTDGHFSDMLHGWSSWQIILTTLLVLMTYDQGVQIHEKPREGSGDLLTLM